MVRLSAIGLASFWIAYYCLLVSGVADVSPVAEPLYSVPLLVSSFLFLIAVAADAFVSNKRRGMHGIVWLLGMMFLCAGYWVGSFMSYDSTVIITEGQTIEPNYLREAASVRYSGKYARSWDAAVTLLELRPELSEDGMRLDGLDASFITYQAGKEIPFELSGRDSKKIGGRSLSISEFGYSPRFELYDGDGRVIDSSFVYLRLFPPGSEDFFRLLSPLTYYVRYYPEGKGHAAQEHFAVRVARNKDLIFSGDVRPGEKFRFENASMSFPEIRKWTELRLRSNPGMPLLYAGVAVLAAAALLRMRRRTG